MSSNIKLDVQIIPAGFCRLTWSHITTYVCLYSYLHKQLSVNGCFIDIVYIYLLSDYLNSIHYRDSLRLFMNNIVDCLTT